MKVQIYLSCSSKCSIKTIVIFNLKLEPKSVIGIGISPESFRISRATFDSLQNTFKSKCVEVQF